MKLRKLWYKNGGQVTHKAWDRRTQQEKARIVTYLKSLPLEYQVKAGGNLFTLVHAAPEELYDQVEHEDDETRTFFSVWEREAIFDLADLEAVKIVFGHTPTAHFQKCNPLSILHYGALIGIDCGAGWPPPDKSCPIQGRLACLRLDDMKEFYSETE